MLNTVDFYQRTEERLAIPAGSMSVYFDGSLCPYLEVIEIVRGSWPEFSWAKLVYNPTAFSEAGSDSIEQIEMLFGMGKAVSIRQVYRNAEADETVFSIPIFAGEVEGVERMLGPEGESIQLIAKDFGCRLKRINVYGQHIVNRDSSAVFLPSEDAIFNAQGRGNASPELLEYQGRSYTAFCDELSRGRQWTLAEVIYYLLCEYLPAGQITVPSLGLLRAMTNDQMVRHLDVTGLNLAEALHQCCMVAGLEYKFVARLCETGPGQAMVLYRIGRGRKVEINCQKAGGQLSVSRTNAARLHGVKSFWPVTHRYIGLGDLKVYEGTFELVRAWDPNDEDTAYDKFSPTSNSDFRRVKDVYRKWCLNEAGDYSIEPYNLGEAFDFSKIFDGSDFARRRRRFWPCLSTDKQSKSLGYYLEVSCDNGGHWRQYLCAFNNLLDECGIWLSSDMLDLNTWIAALKGVLKFRITASVVSDERLSCVIANGPVNSTVPAVDHILRLDSHFKYRKVSSRSIFANGGDTLGVADEMDDTAALYEYIRKKAESCAETIENVNIETLYPAYDYQVGDRVTTSVHGRDILGCRGDNRSICRIDCVRIDFRRQCTELKIVRQRLLV